MSLPIESLTIHAFRGLEEVTLEGLGGVNLLVGDNNSGKTSVLEGITIYCDPLDASAWVRTALQRVKGFSTVTRVEAVKWLFPQGKRASAMPEELFSGDIHISGRGAVGTRDIQAHIEEFEELRAPVQSRLPLGGVEEAAILDQDQVDRSATLTLNLTQQAGQPSREESFILRNIDRLPVHRVRAIACPFALISPFDHALEERYMERFRRALEKGYRAVIVEALQRIDANIQDVEVLPEHRLGFRAALYLKHALTGRTPLSAFGDGVRRVLLLALAVPMLRNGCLLVDEIETAIHISVLGKVFSWLVDSCRQHDVQLFATTHSLEALDAIIEASKEHLGEIAGYRFHDARRVAPPKRFDGEQLYRLRYERGLDVR